MALQRDGLPVAPVLREDLLERGARRDGDAVALRARAAELAVVRRGRVGAHQERDLCDREPGLGDRLAKPL